MMFGRNGIFGVGSSWKKVVRQESSKRKVVLTKVTLLQNGSQCEDILSYPALAKTGNPEDNPVQQTNNHTELAKSGFQSSFSEYAAVNEPSNCTILKLYKSESEDSGVELPSGANSPSTLSGSEQSFVVHRRESSCDSGMALSTVSSSPVIQHCPFPVDCCNSDKCLKGDGKAEGHQEAPVKVKKLHTASANWKKNNSSNRNFNQSPTVIDEEVTQARHVSLVEIVIADTNTPASLSDTLKHANEAQLDQETLKRRPSGDSLKDYMEECCRLSEVNQDKVGDRGSGLGYLEHICQLIETIGQLQDQNKQLQKQDFFLNHCSCGAVGIYRSLASLPDLQTGSSTNFSSHRNSFKGENTSQSIGRFDSVRSQGFDTEPGERQRCFLPMCRNVTNHHEVNLMHSHEEASNLNSRQQDHQVAEGQPSGKVKVLLRNSRLKNRLVRESSSMLKRSCPQLYRPEDGRGNILKKETNSASAWGLNRKSDWNHSP
ncbi:uncharacterized protein LOC144676053 isoform X2 [Cetorhinus maximus]